MSALVQSAPETRHSEVSVEADLVQNRTIALQESLMHLEDRLMTVLAQRQVGEVGGNGQPEPLRVPLAQAMHEHADLIGMLTLQVDSMLARLEL